MARKSRRGRVVWLIAGTLIAFVTLGVFFGILTLVSGNLPQQLVDLGVEILEGPPSNDPSEVVFVVKEGETASEVAARLERERLISNALIFRQLARSRGQDQRIEAGEHRLRRNMSMSEVLEALRKARPRNQMTVLEGWRAAEVADEVEFRGIGAKSEFMSLVASAEWTHVFLRSRPSGAGLEGYLFPDTYALTSTITSRELIGRMLDNFGAKVVPAWDARSTNLGLTLHEAVTLASIVEREARVPDERPLIASVYLNRLREGMLLQADPTVQYAVAPGATRPAEGYWKRELTVDDLASPSPYNTYRYPGLPPGPICNPGLASIVAVLNPAKTDYLYFVAKGDGSHAFARTLAEHNENVRRYQP